MALVVIQTGDRKFVQKTTNFICSDFRDLKASSQEILILALISLVRSLKSVHFFANGPSYAATQKIKADSKVGKHKQRKSNC